ncbi:Ger(x)C family spore germination C-terminal domain-containing protein [Brevibacillus centrosporus]|uniref:Ger(x)C family spore germination protein n=1 Tax=Brevibacillus centrosporus TaxID=54910 RepID=UPI003B02D2B3
MRWIHAAFALAILSGIIATTGCSPFVENNTIEEIAPVIFWSLNQSDDRHLEISTLVPPLIHEKKRMLTLKVDLQKQGGKEFNLIYYRELKPGQLRVIVINEELARKGVLPLISTYLMDTDISQRLYLIISRGNFEEFMREQLNDQANLDYFLYRMLKHYEASNQGEMSILNLHQFKNKLFSPYADPYLPLFEVKKDNFTYKGTAMFRHDKMINLLPLMDDQIFQLIDHDHYLKLFAVPSSDVILGHVRSKVDIDLDPAYKNMTIKIDLTGRLEEYRGNKNLHKREDLAKLHQDIEKYLVSRTSDLLKTMQHWKIDPLEIGTRTLHPFSKPISDSEWLNLWEKMKFKIEYRLTIQPLVNVNQ